MCSQLSATSAGTTLLSPLGGHPSSSSSSFRDHSLRALWPYANETVELSGYIVGELVSDKSVLRFVLNLVSCRFMTCLASRSRTLEQPGQTNSWKWGTGLSIHSERVFVGFHWLMQTATAKTANKQLYLKRHSWNIHAACWRAPQQQQQHEQQLAKWTEQQQTALADRTIAQGAKAADHKWCQTLLSCGITATAIDLRSTQFHYRSLALGSEK